MKKKNKHFVKKNICPYCTYPCDSAFMHEDDKQKPDPFDLSFCLMCCEPSQWDQNMKLIKFDLDSVKDIVERNRLKMIKIKVEDFWNTHPDTDGRREKYLTIMDMENMRNAHKR